MKHMQEVKVYMKQVSTRASNKTKCKSYGKVKLNNSGVKFESMER
jgi:hypothetical protein